MYRRGSQKGRFYKSGKVGVSMTKIYMLRHGETDWNLAGKIQGGTDTVLNENGKRQAIACRSYFQDKKCQAIFSSTLQRAQQTATIMNETLRLPLILIDEFKERNFGKAEGLTLEERLKLYPSKQYPNQESMESLCQRLAKGLHKIQQGYPHDEVILVTHGAVIHTIFDMVEKMAVFQEVPRLSNGGISTISYEKEKWLLETYNDTNYMTDLK